MVLSQPFYGKELFLRILLVSPSGQTRFEYCPSIGLMNLFLIAVKLGCEVELLDMTWLSYRKSLSKLTEKQYDLVGISCSFTNTAPYCMKYARQIKNKYPNTMVISGGIHATFVPEDLLSNQYDYVLYGELFKRKGDQSKARETLGKSIEILKECGADGWVEKYEKELAKL